MPVPLPDPDGDERRTSQRRISVPLVVWRELLNGGVMGMVTREPNDADLAPHVLLPASDLVIMGGVDERTGNVRRYLFSHYAQASDD
jgi:hypothetical protein